MRLLIFGLLLQLASAGPAAASGLAWADWADLAVAADAVVVARVADIDRIDRRAAADVPPGEGRLLIRGDLTGALKAPALLPASVAWIWQGAVDRRGRPQFARGAPVLLFAIALSGGGDPAVQPLRLVAAAGQQPWSEADEATVRAILREAALPQALRAVVRSVDDGFHTEGQVPGASESQIFATTGDGQKLALVVRRAADSPPLVLAAAGDLVEAAGPIAPRTLLWRALACGLPEVPPEKFQADAALVADYVLAREVIGACGRTLAVTQR